MGALKGGEGQDLLTNYVMLIQDLNHKLQNTFFEEQCHQLCLILVVSYQCWIQTFLGHTVFLKLKIGQFSDTQILTMVVAECLKLFVFNVFGEEYLCLLKIFLFLSICGLYFIYILREIYIEKNCLGAFFWVPIPFKPYQNTSGCGAVSR